MVYVCPGFEEERLRELILMENEVRAWEEHESPYRLMAGILKDHVAASGRVGIEESVRFFLVDGIRKQAPRLELVSADPVTISCRAYKSSTEIALMQRAMDITSEAFKVSISLLREGMSQEEFAAHSRAAHKALGVSGEIGCQSGASTAYPHRSNKPEHLKEGDVVLMNGICTVDGITPTSAGRLSSATPRSVRERCGIWKRRLKRRHLQRRRWVHRAGKWMRRHAR